jgi:hypothetical protein
VIDRFQLMAVGSRMMASCRAVAPDQTDAIATRAPGMFGNRHTVALAAAIATNRQIAQPYALYRTEFAIPMT